VASTPTRSSSRPGGDRLFYTGDLREHGRKAWLFDELLADPPRFIDALLCEGTHIRAGKEQPEPVPEEPGRSETDVELSLARRMRATAGAVAVLSSAQNIDRLVTVYRACLRAGRTLVTDLYSASIVTAIGRSTIPQPGFPSYKVYVPTRQRVQVKTSGQFDRMALVSECRVFPEWLAGRAGEITLLQPSSAMPELLREGILTGGAVVWSMWPGYLQDAGGMRLTYSLNSEGIPFAVDHSSGRATTSGLRRLVTALNPKVVVPIHSEGALRYGDHFDRVQWRSDHEWWSV
jgi:ribonuclease J